MTLAKIYLTWFILLTGIYLLDSKLASYILGKKCINYNVNKFKSLCLLYSLVNIIFISFLLKKKIYQSINKMAIDLINIFMLSLASILDLIIMEVDTYFLRIILLISLLASRKENIRVSILDALIVYLILYIVYQLTRGSIGGADVRILTILSFGYGFRASMLILIYAAWICLVFSLRVCFAKRSDRYEEIAFVPYIHSAYIFLLYSQKI